MRLLSRVLWDCMQSSHVKAWQRLKSNSERPPSEHIGKRPPLLTDFWIFLLEFHYEVLAGFSKNDSREKSKVIIQKKVEGSSCNTFDNLILGIIHHHSCHILFVRIEVLYLAPYSIGSEEWEIRVLLLNRKLANHLWAFIWTAILNNFEFYFALRFTHFYEYLCYSQLFISHIMYSEKTISVCILSHLCANVFMNWISIKEVLYEHQ